MKYSENERNEFIRKLQHRTKKFAIEIIEMCNHLPKNKASDVVSYQIIKSATSQAANYRAACRARSKAEFFAKMSIVVEESDETSFWLEMLKDARLIDDDTFQKLHQESEELLSIFSTARKNAKLNKKY